MSRIGNPNKLSSLVSPRDVRPNGNTPLYTFLNTDCKSGDLDLTKAHQFFNQMLHMRPPPPISCFYRLLGALVKRSHFSDAVSCYKRLDLYGFLGFRSDPIILNILLNCYSSMKLGSVASSAIGLILKNGHCPSVVALSSLVKGLCLEGKLIEAVGLVSKMFRLGCDPDVVTYNTVLNGLCKTGNVITALQLHRQMVNCKESIKRSTISFSLIDGSCIEWPSAGLFVPDVVSYRHLIDQLCLSGMEEDAKSLVFEMLDRGFDPSTVPFDIVINVLCRKGRTEDGMVLLEKMVARGKFPSIVTCNNGVMGYCQIGKIDHAMRLYEGMVSRGLFANNLSMNALLKGLFDVEKVGDALDVFEQMKKVADGVTYGTMIRGLCKDGCLGEARKGIGKVEYALRLYEDMTSRGLFANNLAMNTLLKGLFNVEKVGDALDVFEQMKKVADGVTYGTMIRGLCKDGLLGEARNGIGKVEYALRLYEDMTSRGFFANNLTMNALLIGLFDVKRVNDAINVFERMKKVETCGPDGVTYATMIRGLCKAKRSDKAKEIFSQMKSCGVSVDVVSHNILIDGLYRSGKVDDANTLLETMIADGKVLPSATTFSIIVNNIGRNKNTEKAIKVLGLVTRRGELPDIVTFNRLIKWICWQGDFGLARNVMSLMERFGYKFDVITYNTVITGFCKAGMLGEAENLLDEMVAKGCEPDEVTFGTLIRDFTRENKPGRVNKLRSKIRDIKSKSQGGKK